MADVRDKLTALHSLVETTLQAHDATYKVYDRPRQLFLDAKSRAKRVSIMGDPIRYAEVTLDSIQADAEPMTRLADGRAIAALSTQAGRTIDRFNIEVLWEYEDAATLAASSYASFLDAVVSKDGSTKSLIGKLRETATLTAGSEIVSLDNPTIVDLQWIPVDMTGSIYAHYALITIDVI
jgi:hypothetical protein